jgi:uncharacterized membrane protein (UPF0127 family)
MDGEQELSRSARASAIPASVPRAYAFNQTRQAFLASELEVADTHWSRLKGLMGRSASAFAAGKGLWIVPCHGVHTLAMGYAVDVVYLDATLVVVHVEENVKPWRVTPLRMDAATVIEIPCHTVWNTGTKVGDQIEIVVGNGEAA